MGIMPDIPININWTAFAAKTVYWLGYILIVLISMAVVFFAIHYLTFNIKATTWSLFGGSKKGFSIGKKKNERYKWIRGKTAWRPLYPLFNKKEVEPFPADYIYPKNQIYAYKLDDILFPAKLNFDIDDNDTYISEVKLVPYSVRNWQSLTHKRLAEQFAQRNFWEDNKYFILTTITVIACCIVAGLTVYLTYQFATGGSNNIGALSSAINSLANQVSGSTQVIN